MTCYYCSNKVTARCCALGCGKQVCQDHQAKGLSVFCVSCRKRVDAEPMRGICPSERVGRITGTRGMRFGD